PRPTIAARCSPIAACRTSRSWNTQRREITSPANALFAQLARRLRGSDTLRARNNGPEGREERTALIEIPSLNSPFHESTRHFEFDDEGITNEILNGRRPSSHFVPIARAKKRGK